MEKVQYYGIKYPFVAEDTENYFVDVNKSYKDKVRSQLMHIVFTPKGQKLRDPEFGTDLIKYIFEPNDNESWEGIKSEVMDAVKKYINGITINNISIMQNDEETHEIFVRLDYTVSDGFSSTKDSIAVKL